MAFKITLADGTILSNIGINGTTLVSPTPIDESIMEYNLSPVKFEWEGPTPNDLSYTMFLGEHEHMTYQSIISPIDGEYWFVLTDIPKEELKYAELRSNILYLAMMTDVDLYQ